MNTPTNIDIAKTSDFVVTMLNKAKDHGTPIRGSIHSVYKHTINLQFGDSLLALQCEDSPASPVSLILPLTGAQMDDLKLTQLTPCYLYGESIEIHDAKTLILVHLKDSTEIYHSRPASFQNCMHLNNAITSEISASAKGGFSTILSEDEEEPKDLILAGAKKHLRNASQLLQEGHIAESALAIAEVIGLGTGLTPSGDDFLCGLLSVLQYAGNEIAKDGDAADFIHEGPADSATDHSAKSKFLTALIPAIQKNLYRTNDISGTFLESALAGNYSEAVVNLFQEADQDTATFEPLTQAFQDIGHSSGMDTLCGMKWGLEHLII